MSPFARFNNLDASKQTRILEVALDEFIAHGYEAASLNQIIQQSEMSKGSFYYYFEDKADLLVTILRQELSLARCIGSSGILTSTDYDSFWGAFEQMIQDGIEVLQRNPSLIRLSQILHALPHPVRQQGKLAAFIHELVGQVGQVIEHGQQAHAVRDDIPTAIMVHLWMSVDMILDQWAFTEWDATDRARHEELVALGLDVFKRVFLPAAAITMRA